MYIGVRLNLNNQKNKKAPHPFLGFYKEWGHGEKHTAYILTWAA